MKKEKYLNPNVICRRDEICFSLKATDCFVPVNFKCRDCFTVFAMTVHCALLIVNY